MIMNVLVNMVASMAQLCMLKDRYVLRKIIKLVLVFLAEQFVILTHALVPGLLVKRECLIIHICLCSSSSYMGCNIPNIQKSLK